METLRSGRLPRRNVTWDENADHDYAFLMLPYSKKALLVSPACHKYACDDEVLRDWETGIFKLLSNMHKGKGRPPMPYVTECELISYVPYVVKEAEMPGQIPSQGKTAIDQ